MSAYPPSSPSPVASRGVSMPRGEEIASFATYAEAQHAVDALSDEGFPVQYLSIIGTDLRQVERITGRMSWGRAVVTGMGSGLWIGVLFAAVMSLFSPSGSTPTVSLVGCVALGVVWGVLFQVVGYAMTRGRRDFTSISQVVASRYSIIAAQDAREAALALAEVPGNLTRGGQAALRAQERRRARAEASGGPTAFGSRPDEEPRFGVRIPPQGEAPLSGAPQDPGAARPGPGMPAPGAPAPGAPGGAGAESGSPEPAPGPVPADYDPFARPPSRGGSDRARGEE
ncbi:general stress protein [Actinomyces bowdenii]|nr:general stress protein [Actinomyces bowdenii]